MKKYLLLVYLLNLTLMLGANQCSTELVPESMSLITLSIVDKNDTRVSGVEGTLCFPGSIDPDSIVNTDLFPDSTRENCYLTSESDPEGKIFDLVLSGIVSTEDFYKIRFVDSDRQLYCYIGGNFTSNASQKSGDGYLKLVGEERLYDNDCHPVYASSWNISLYERSEFAVAKEGKLCLGTNTHSSAIINEGITPDSVDQGCYYLDNVSDHRGFLLTLFLNIILPDERLYNVRFIDNNGGLYCFGGLSAFTWPNRQEGNMRLIYRGPRVDYDDQCNLLNKSTLTFSLLNSYGAGLSGKRGSFCLPISLLQGIPGIGGLMPDPNREGCYFIASPTDEDGLILELTKYALTNPTDAFLTRFVDTDGGLYCMDGPSSSVTTVYDSQQVGIINFKYIGPEEYYACRGQNEDHLLLFNEAEVKIFATDKVTPLAGIRGEICHMEGGPIYYNYVESIPSNYPGCYPVDGVTDSFGKFPLMRFLPNVYSIDPNLPRRVYFRDNEGKTYCFTGGGRRLSPYPIKVFYKLSKLAEELQAPDCTGQPSYIYNPALYP